MGKSERILPPTPLGRLLRLEAGDACRVERDLRHQRQCCRASGPPKTSRAFSWHVQGDLFLTGDQWSGSLIADDRGNPSGYAWRFDFNEGRAFDDDEISFYTNNRA